MNFANLFRIALRALGNNKMRGFLTMLGIIIGVASVITMLAIGQGSKRSIRAQIAEMGSNMIMIHPGADMRGGVRQDPAAMQSLKLDDYQAIVDETRYVSACSPSVSSSGQAIYGSNNYPTSILKFVNIPWRKGICLRRRIFSDRRKSVSSGKRSWIICLPMGKIRWGKLSASEKYLSVLSES